MVKKYFTAKDALTNFRAFLGHIAQDDSLHPAITTPSAPIQDKPVSKAPPKAEQRAQPNPFSRFVEISESELPSSTQEPACFIQQQLLASQQQPRRAVKPFSTSGDDDYNSLIQFTQPRMQQCSSQMDIISSQSDKDRGRPPMDLRAKLALLKTKESQTAPASKVLINQPFGKPSGSTDLLFSQISDNRQIIDLFSEDKADDDGDEGFGLSTSSSVPLSQAVPSSQSQLAAPSDESKPKLSSSILSQAFKTAKTNAAQGGASKLIAGDRNATEGYILEILSQLKNKVSTEEIAQLKGLFTKVKRQGGLQNLSQVQKVLVVFNDIILFVHFS
ncbi:hypothetical protein EON65_21340 [archaeon]|nr:MAG: hypothetical protein EON65_21340 [archaeon]